MTDQGGRERGPIEALPATPSLDWLRKRAKQELRDLRTTRPDAQLADAQRALARRHGFASWRKLKAFVDAVTGHGDELRRAVRAGDLARVAQMLDSDPELVHTGTDLEERERPSDEPSMSLLHLAVAENNAAMVELLVARGAPLDARNANGRTALHDCFELNRDPIAKRLVKAGATVDACAAAAYGDHARLLTIVRADPAQANDLTTGMTPLGWAGFAHDAESAQILIEHGAIIDRSPYDLEAWDPTCTVAAVPVARVLIEHGADPNWQDAQDGNTPLHRVLASRIVRDPTAFVRLLLEAGADPRRRNREGKTPLDLALDQRGREAETYFPARPIGAKQLDDAIALLGAPRGDGHGSTGD